MFLSAVDSLVIWIVVPIIVVQYAFAVFCLLKLAYFDVSKKEYVLWNLFILIVFFIGGTAFLIYYYKHPDRRVKPLSETDNAADVGKTGENERDRSQEAPAEDTDARSADEADPPNIDASGLPSGDRADPPSVDGQDE